MADTTPYRIEPDDRSIPDILTLIRDSFAFMQGRIDPPSSMHQLTVTGIALTAASAEVWVIGRPPFACVFLTPQDTCLYLGKLAVALDQRDEGHALRLMRLAEQRAKALGLPKVELEARVELTENHGFFAAMGFRKIAESAHPGYDRPTSYRFRKDIS